MIVRVVTRGIWDVLAIFFFVVRISIFIDWGKRRIFDLGCGGRVFIDLLQGVFLLRSYG